MLEIWSNRTDIIPLTKDNLLSSSAPNIIGGLTTDADKGPEESIGRTFVGVEDRDSDGQLETVLIFNSASSTQSNAKDTLTSFGANGTLLIMAKRYGKL